MITIKTAKKQKLKESKGITLIALVITIIVLLILAGVTIATLTGDNGILKKAGDAKTQTEQAKEDENLKIAIAGSYGTDGKLNLKDLKDNLENQGINYDKNNTGFPLEVTVNGEKKKIDANGNVTAKLESVADSKTKGTVFKDTTTLEDTYGNQVKVPKGFKIASDSATDVTRGIVIEDATYTNTIGSQFVWIPVGDIRASDGSTKTIELNRYTFGSDGTSTTQGTNVIGDFYQELSTSLYGNSVAKNLYGFIASVDNNYGYYLGRYEMGTDTQRTSSSDELTQVKVQENKYVYNYVTQSQASTLSQNMYTSDSFTSDLINSYAWDTAIVFIQKCGTGSNSSTYSYTAGLSSSSTSAPQTTGTNILKATNKIDKQCNIFDMAGNCYEWATETSSHSGGHCVFRGGDYNGSYVYPSGRLYGSTSYACSNRSFRPLLYL